MIQPKLKHLTGCLADACFRGSFNDIVHVKVGPEKRLFNIHKELLCDVSDYFAAALKGNFKETQDQVIELEEEDVSLFERFQLWLYSRSLLSDEETVKGISWQALIELYLFGEVRHIPDLRNAAVDALIDKQQTEPKLPTLPLHYVYSHTNQGSLLRKLFADMAAHIAGSNWFAQGFRDEFPHDFLLDVIMEMDRLRETNLHRIRAFHHLRSNYHVTMPAIEGIENSKKRSVAYQYRRVAFSPSNSNVGIRNRNENNRDTKIDSWSPARC